MKHKKLSFRHESLQDSKTIKDVLKALTDGMGKGKLTFSDSDDSVTLEPGGLMNLKISASQEDHINRVNIRISWQSDKKTDRNKTIKVKSGRGK